MAFIPLQSVLIGGSQAVTLAICRMAILFPASYNYGFYKGRDVKVSRASIFRVGKGAVVLRVLGSIIAVSKVVRQAISYGRLGKGRHILRGRIFA